VPRIVVLDLTGLQPSYGTPVRRASRWLFLGAYALIAVGAVGRLFDRPDGFDVGLSGIQVICFGLVTYVNVIRPPAFFLSAEGVRFRRFLRTGPTLLWADVRTIEVRGRWQEHSRLVHRDGRLLPLVGMPEEDAERLADALTAARAGGGPPESPPAPDASS